MDYHVATSFYHPIFEITQGPFVSIYFETSPYGLDRQKNQINLKNAINKLDKHELSHFIDQLNELVDDVNFWNQVKSGLAILMTPDQNVIYFLPDPVKSSLHVGEMLHILPLLRHFQQLTEVQLLLLNREEFKIYQGTYHEVRPLAYPNDEPILSKDVLGTDTSQRYFSNAPGGRVQGDDGKSTLNDVDMMRYFQYVDKYVHDFVSKESQLPLVLVALPEYHSHFREISENEFLMKEGIKMDFSRFSNETLALQLENLMTPHIRNLLQSWRDRFRTAQANGQASDFVEDVLSAVIEKRVDTLFINRQKSLHGLLNLEDQTYLIDEKRENDLLNEIAILALKAKSKVLVLDEDEMPTPATCAIITRY